MIQVSNLHKKYGAFHALKGININVEKGEIYGFLGHNGAGKSTTMNILAGLSKATEGTCVVNGWDMTKVAHPGDLHIGYLPEEPKMYNWMTAKEVLTYLGSNWKNCKLSLRVEEMLDWVGLKKAANRKIGGFSRGMKQRLGMAAALFYNPDMVLLDEPSSALDPEGRSDVLNLIMDLKSNGKTVFLSTHILSDVERVCDRVGIISNGKMVLEKSLKILLKENIKSVYDITLHKGCYKDLKSRISSLKGVLEVHNGNDLLSVTVDCPEKAVNSLLQFFADEKILVESFNLKRASLEDIFLEEVSKNES